MGNTSGFTLIELILVTVILGILAAAIVPQFRGVGEDARIQRAKSDILNLENAIERYAIRNNDKFPDNLNVLVSGERKYIRRLQKDPWGNPYNFNQPGKRSGDVYDLFSSGPDGVPGNEDDIGNWDLE